MNPTSPRSVNSSSHSLAPRYLLFPPMLDEGSAGIRRSRPTRGVLRVGETPRRSWSHACASQLTCRRRRPTRRYGRPAPGGRLRCGLTTPETGAVDAHARRVAGLRRGIRHRGLARTPTGSGKLNEVAEVGTRFELAYDGFANHCLTTWLPHRGRDGRLSTDFRPWGILRCGRDRGCGIPPKP